MKDWLVAVLLSGFGLLALLAECAPVVVASHNYPPFSDAQGRGMVNDIVSAAFAAEGLDAKTIAPPIRRAKVQLMSGEIDAMAGPKSFFTPDEQQRLLSSSFYYVLPCWFFYAPRIQNPENILDMTDLKGYRVGVIVDSPYLGLYRDKGLEVVQIQTPEQLLQMARHGRIDVFESTLLTGLHLIQQLAADDEERFDYIRWGLLSVELNFLKTRESSRVLQRTFETGLEKIHASGELLQIFERYWGEGNVPQAVFINQWPYQGVDSVSARRFWSFERNAYGRVLEAKTALP